MPRGTSVFRTAALIFGTLAFSPTLLRAANLYVDGQIASSSCTNYAPATRACASGSDRAYRTLSGAATAAVAGDTVYLRAGTYSEQLVPARSGTASQPITFAAYPGEAPRISNVSNPALWLIQRSYIVIDGLTVTNVGGWGRLEDASYNIIRNNTFTVATIGGTTGGLKLVRSTYNRILDNIIEDGNDNITVQESDRNVFQGNTIATGRHSLLSLRCGNYNVVRGNTFSNPDQKDLEIYDCEGTSDAPVKLDATKRNLVEGNVIADTAASSSDNDYNGIQFAGQQGIVRRNVFQDDMGGGINIQFYSDESLYNYKNRIYHNTFYGNRCYGVVGGSGDSRYYDNRVRNNILYKNTNCSGSGAQVSISDTSKVILSDNALATTSPGFVNEGGRDFQLAPGSPMIDAAAFLTTTTAAGSGTQITVADASYFFDGYGIPGELGDEIQLQGQTTVARVLAVDLTTNRLTLDRSLTWTSGLGVALRFNGAKPDLGAFESGAAALPSLSVNDVTLAEGNSGTSLATFTVTLSPASTQTVTVSYATADGSATAGSDYTAASGSLSFAPGVTSRTASVSVTGDTTPEGNEDFFLNLSGPTNAVLGDGQGRATVQNDDAVTSALSIADAATTEGNTGTKTLAFTVTLSPASASTVGVSYTTANGTATAGSDYVAQAGNLTFTAGQTTKTISVTVNGDTTVEPDETFTVTLSSPSGATLADAQATGTITNDDSTPPGTEPVVWANAVGVSISTSSITKTAASAWGNAGAASTRAVNGDGYLEFTLPAAPGYAMVGLANGDTDQGYADIDFALYTYPGNGTLHVVEKGTYRGSLGAYASGDRLRVAVESGLVKYYRNGTLRYTSTQAPVLPLRVDTSLYSSGTTVSDATLAGTLVNVPWSTTEVVAWVNAVGVDITSSRITKTAATAWGNAGAASSRAIAGDGHVEFTLPASPGYAMFGLSNGDTDLGYADVDFAFYTYPGAELVLVYERGTYRGALAAYASGDKLKIGIQGGVVSYYRNGTLLYASTQIATVPLRADTSFYTTGASLQAAALSGSLVSVP